MKRMWSNTPHVFRGTCQVTMVPKCLATCQRTHTRKPGLIWMLSCMGLNNVDVSCIGIGVLRDPRPTLSHGATGRWWL
ncbi:hypothetical protein ACN38_g4414 [Penicillium nordicum]|uniref:Uncharacterized protein n=1 Tax=Penicillium nordicum TaxID=229535 RepID=A0A0M8P6N2_9EURO|nr:hypothetical protein ACN38_g4414 [Penicillium nordicum]